MKNVEILQARVSSRLRFGGELFYWIVFSFLFFSCDNIGNKPRGPLYRLEYVSIMDEVGTVRIQITDEMRSSFSEKVVSELNLIGAREMQIQEALKDGESVGSLSGPIIVSLQIVNTDSGTRVFSSIHMEENGKVFLTSSIPPESCGNIGEYLYKLVRENPRKREPTTNRPDDSKISDEKSENDVQLPYEPQPLPPMNID